jgi:hypothetical protein
VFGEGTPILFKEEERGKGRQEGSPSGILEPGNL